MPRDTRSTDRCTRFESADLVHVCGCELRSPILRPAPDTRSLSFNAFPSPFPREVLLSRNWRIEENIGDCLEEMLSEGVLFVSFA